MVLDMSVVCLNGGGVMASVHHLRALCGMNGMNGKP
jgi:hypothetical protein